MGRVEQVSSGSKTENTSVGLPLEGSFFPLHYPVFSPEVFTLKIEG